MRGDSLESDTAAVQCCEGLKIEKTNDKLYRTVLYLSLLNTKSREKNYRIGERHS